jgi:hypothetical protein
MSTLNTRTHAGNSSDTQSVRPMLISSTMATAMPANPIQGAMTLVRSVITAVLMVNTAAIRIA